MHALALAATLSAYISLTAAGGSFPAVIYGKWFEQLHRMDPGLRINYQPIGSGGGIKQLTEGTVDFGASDKSMTDREIESVIAKRGFKPLHFPTVVGAVVPIYNLPGIARDLNFTGDSLARIFLGTVTNWDDPAIAAANPGVTLPKAPIAVVVRSDSSGTTFVLTDFLTKASPLWAARIHAGSAPNWPTGLRAKGSEGVAGQVKQLPWSIGYVELTYAIQNNMRYGSVRNAAGKFVKADRASVNEAAARGAEAMPDDFRVSIANSPGPDAYPICSFTWLLIPSRVSDPAKRRAITGFLSWMLAEGQQSAIALHYGPLPPTVIERERRAIASIQ